MKDSDFQCNGEHAFEVSFSSYSFTILIHAGKPARSMWPELLPGENQKTCSRSIANLLPLLTRPWSMRPDTSLTEVIPCLQPSCLVQYTTLQRNQCTYSWGGCNRSHCSELTWKKEACLRVFKHPPKLLITFHDQLSLSSWLFRCMWSIISKFHTPWCLAGQSPSLCYNSHITSKWKTTTASDNTSDARGFKYVRSCKSAAFIHLHCRFDISNLLTTLRNNIN